MKTIWSGVIQGRPFNLVAEDMLSATKFTLVPAKDELLEGIIKGITGFAKAHPFLTGWLAGAAVDAVKKYNEAKKTSVKFHAEKIEDRPRYMQMIKDMEKNGFRIVKQGYTKGTGYFWELNK